MDLDELLLLEHEPKTKLKTEKIIIKLLDNIIVNSLLLYIYIISYIGATKF